MRMALFGALGLMLLGAAGGCVRRTLTVTSDPPGALVYLNNEEFGRTPVTRDFLWYGTYDVTLRREGYETQKTTAKVIAPWWQWPPIDLLAEMFPVHDKRELSYKLTPASTQPVDPVQILSNAQQMEKQLEGSRSPTTAPATRPCTTPQCQPST